MFSRRILELGSGSGFTGLCILNLFDVEEYIFSDGNEQVLSNLGRNLKQNSSVQHNKLELLNLDWGTMDDTKIANLNPDVILASGEYLYLSRIPVLSEMFSDNRFADVAYSEDVISLFFHALKLLAKKFRSPIFVAQKRRKPETMDFFLKTAGRWRKNT